MYRHHLWSVVNVKNISWLLYAANNKAAWGKKNMLQLLPRGDF